MSEELLSMFFDDEFVPHAYLDAFFTNGSKSINLKNQSTINQLQNNSSLLLSNLDFLTNELTNDLESKINKLYNSNSIVSYSYQNLNNNNTNNDNSSKLKPTSRLEYYIDSLIISIQSLKEIIETTSNKINDIKGGTPSDSEENQTLTSTNTSTVQKLINLSTAKVNLLQVLKNFELLKSIIDISKNNSSNQNDISKITAPTSTSSMKNSQNIDNITTTPLEFQNSLNSLSDTIIEQFNLKISKEDNHTIDFEFLKKINNFINLLPIFKNLNGFYNIYNDFIKKVNKSKQNYLNTKDSEYFENFDDLFNEVLN
ncbi:Conserved oligomeric Golgi complex subunit [Wickerhamomyces ciferrii]|uniref:Conserved oligomeric Golgi complex subunit n=1 Tax=Wickerhamomyces ciferrii (strain ATCC 14091 / BCRC 22168 / CBS 111 / JCM 3599 / NBRC 0793 / NRRL Y-1031 F-60-10) TaxID=1206466 RepID=K0KRE7_WICCF|nr:Conserved oligomeric Golgi complex subunit [Wickerhamomyces ciferrii]CCH45716.1 Conserved oligomeric Golgi complex subunit [Wickerhamomyces ciferrii]